MLDPPKPASLGLSVAVAFFLVLIASCGSPTTDIPQVVSTGPPDDNPATGMPTPTTARPSPTDAVKATIPSQPEAAALLGTWTSDRNFVLELGSSGVYTLTRGRREPDTGNWSLQEDGNIVLEGQSYVAIPHGNLLLLGREDGTFTLRVLQRVDDDGNLMAYEPTSAIQIPPLDSSAILTITIADYWTGFSPLAPIEADFRLEPATGYFSGTAEFSVAGYTEAITRSAPISVPLAVIDELLALLESTPLEVGEYRPVFEHTDDFPAIKIAVEGRAGGLEFASESQGSRHIPWRAMVGRDQYVTYADTPVQALDLLDPYLARDVQQALFDLALARDQ